MTYIKIKQFRRDFACRRAPRIQAASAKQRGRAQWLGAASCVKAGTRQSRALFTINYSLLTALQVFQRVNIFFTKKGVSFKDALSSWPIPFGNTKCKAFLMPL